MIEEICDLIQKDLPSTLSDAFLSIYTHLNLYETKDITSKGIAFVNEFTENTLNQLLKSDVKVFIEIISQ